VTRDIIQPSSVHDPRPRYSQAIKTTGGSLLFIAGQTSVDAAGQIVGTGDIVRQAEQVFANLQAVLEAAGGSFANLVMTTTYLTDAAYRPAFGEVRARCYGRDVPASTLVIVKGLANPDFLIEIDAIAVI
jgi:enamine deaminase RidA (YjgF/YER057c/UK114 family)